MAPPARQQGQVRGCDFPAWRSGPQHLAVPGPPSSPRAGQGLVDLPGRKMGKAEDPAPCV